MGTPQLHRRQRPPVALRRRPSRPRCCRRRGSSSRCGPTRPAKIGATFLRWGASPATGIATAAIHHPDATFIVDERGSLTFAEVHRRTNALAHAFAKLGIGYGDGVGIMCRNHRGFIEATLAAAKLGASALYLNTMFAGPQLVEVMRREGPKALVYDEEFAGLLDGVDESVQRVVGWTDGDAAGATLDSLIADNGDADLKPPPEKPSFVILTSGTTGHPEGRPALQPRRAAGDGGDHRQDPLPQPRDDRDRRAALPLLGLLPLRRQPADRRDARPAPPLRPRGDAEGGRGAPRQRARRGPGDAPADPPAARRDARPLHAARPADHRRSRGSALPGELAPSGWTASATTSTTSTARPRSPGRRSPPPRTCAPRPARPAGRRAAPWSSSSTRTARRCRAARSGGSSSATKWPSRATPAAAARRSSTASSRSGDVGHFDDGGRLFIDGRDDEMIVSGGENVFPREVEDLLADHDAVVEVAVIGVEDEEFGQRLKAFVVARDGRRGLRGGAQGATSRRTSPPTRRRARSSSSTSCRATRPARS